MTTLKCQACGAVWTEGPTRDYREDQTCRKCLTRQSALLVEALEMAAKALSEAEEDIESWGAYASGYFQEKWDLSGDVARCRADYDKAISALAAVKGGA